MADINERFHIIDEALLREIEKMFESEYKKQLELHPGKDDERHVILDGPYIKQYITNNIVSVGGMKFVDYKELQILTDKYARYPGCCVTIHCSDDKERIEIRFNACDILHTDKSKKPRKSIFSRIMSLF